MWGLITGLIALVIVLVSSITLYFQQEKLKEAVNGKLNNVVDQINDSQFYEYKFDQQQDDNIKNVDRNLTSVYDAVVNTQANVNFMKKSMLAREEVSKSVFSDNVKTNALNLGEKFRFSGVGEAQGNDEWLRLTDRSGNDYYGGLAAKQLWSRDNAWLNGSTTVSGQLNVDGRASFKGARSDMNPNKKGTHFPNADGKNYISGDTEVLGHVTHNGVLNANQIKLGHTMGGWTNDSVMTTYAANGKIGASFGGSGGLWSHFPWKDDQSTYIRPGREGAAVYVGDMGAAKVSLGKGDTNIEMLGDVKVKKGKICIDSECITADDLRRIKAGGQSGIIGRYVKLFADDKTQRTLHVVEIEVFDVNGNLVSAGKTCSASTTLNDNSANYGPQYLVDGVYTAINNGQWRLPQTKDQPDPWFLIDLGSEVAIKKVVVHNRDDCCQDKIVGCRLGVLGEQKNLIFSEKITNSQRTYTFTF